MNVYELGQLKELLTQALLILGVVAVIVLPWLIKARERARIHDTLSRAMEHGVAPSPQVLKAITDTMGPPGPERPQAERDLRSGVIWLSVAVGLGLLGLGIALGHDPRSIELPIRHPLAALGIAALPAALGVGYLILWAIGRHEHR